MYKNFRVSDEERKQILEMHQSNGYNASSNLINEADGGWSSQVGKAAGDPQWLMYPATQQASVSPINMKFNAPQYVQKITYMAGNASGDKIIIPGNRTWTRTPSGYFMVTKAYKVVPGGKAEFDAVRGYKDTNYLNQVLKDGTIKFMPVDVAALKGVGGIIYTNSDTAAGLLGNASALSDMLQKL